MLGAPEWIKDKVLSSSEAWEYVVDPTTGVAGIKFDKEYSSNDGGGQDQDKGKGKKIAGEQSGPKDTTSDSRTVLVTLAGHYNWSITEVSIKAGQEVYHSTITAPIQIYQGDEDECEM